MDWKIVGGEGADRLGEWGLAGETSARDFGKVVVKRRAIGRWMAFCASNNFRLFLAFAGGARWLFKFFGGVLSLEGKGLRL